MLGKEKNGPAWNNKPAPITTTPKLIPVPLLPIASSGTPFPDDPRLNRRLVWLILAHNSYHTKMNEMPSLRKALQQFSAKNKSTISWTTGDRNITAPQYRISFLCFFIQNISIDQVDSQNPHTRSIWKRHQLANNSLQNMCTISISCSSWWLTDDSI